MTPRLGTDVPDAILRIAADGRVVYHWASDEGSTTTHLGRPISELFSSNEAPPLAERLEPGRIEWLVLTEADGGKEWRAQLAPCGPSESLLSLYDPSRRGEERTDVVQQQVFEAVGRMAGAIAHDFNNLLTGVLTYGDFLASTLDESDERAQDVRAINRAAVRAASLTRQLLAFSRQQVLEPRIVDLNEVVCEIETFLDHVVGDGVDLELCLSDGMLPVEVDPTQIERVLVNLVVNAGEAMPGGGTIRVSTSKLDDPAGVVLEVADDGPGMSADTLERAFEPFFTTKKGQIGAGLGLSTAHGVIGQSGGDIQIHTEPGLGTKVRVFLPALAEQASRPTPSTPGPRAHRGSATILLVEDDRLVRTSARRALEGQGYQLLVAEDGQEALQLLGRFGGRVDLVLTDVVMPRVSGVELARRLREQDPEQRILFMSGYVDNGSSSALGELSAHPILRKPFTIAELGTKVRSVLGG